MYLYADIIYPKRYPDGDVRIQKANGSDLAAGDKVSLINYPVASLFSSVQVMLNNREILHGGAHYAV